MKKILLFVILSTLSVTAWAQSLAISQTGPSPTYVVAQTSTISITVFNTGGIPSTGATVAEAIPAGMNFIGFSGTNWSCVPISGSDPVGTVTCTYSAAIPAGGGTSTPLSINVQPRRSIRSTSPTNNISVDATGGAAPPAPSGCTGLNTPSIGCGVPLVSAVPAANSNVNMGPQGNSGSRLLNNMTTNREHYDHTTWPQPSFASLAGNIVVVSPKTIKNTGDIPWSFGLVQGNKEGNHADIPNYFSYTGALAGLFYDNAPDITSEVSFNGGGTWVQLMSAAGLSPNTTNLTRNIHTIDPTHVPFNGIVLQPGQSLDFLVRHTFPNARYTGRKNVTITIYAGLYLPGTQTSLFSEGFTNITGARSWVAPSGATGTWGGIAPTNEIFESTGDTIITGSIDVQKAQTIVNGTGVGAATDAVKNAIVTYTITITGKLPNATPTSSLSAGPWDRVERFPLQSSAVQLIEDGAVAPNNWATWTDAVPGSATCSSPATISGDTAGSSLYNFNLTNPVTAGQVITCSFQRKIK